MSFNGITQQAIVADRNESVDNSIDMTSDVWVKFGRLDNGDGSVIKSLTWSIAA